MPRNISFSMTTPQFIDGSKDVTRRFGWWNLKLGIRLMAVEKGMGLKKGEKVNRLGLIEVVQCGAEKLRAMIDDWAYGLEELKREGYPFGYKDPEEFINALAKHHKTTINAYVNRIEFKRVQS